MSILSVILFVLSIFIIGIYLCPELGDIDDDEVEFTFIDLVFLLVSIVYFVWFIYTYAKSYFA